MNGNDTISRSEVLEALSDLYWMDERLLNFREEIDEVFDKVRGLPSAQRELIRCKDCKHFCKENECPLSTWWTHVEDDFCSYAEQPDCSDCIKHGGDWDCDHVHCHKDESAQPKSVNLKIEKIKKHRADFSDLDEFEPCEAKEMNDTIYRQDAIDALIAEWNKELKTTWECGEEMYVCPRCGRFVPMDMNFCGYCGVYLNKEKYC